MVSVLMVTYNHENYIAKAIEGVLMQETNYSFELIISNDFSTDRTEFVIKDLIKNNSKGNLVKYFSHKSNIGMIPNFMFALEQCNSRYIALCDGDDYWTDPFKLQKQLDFLEANSDYAICFHGVFELREGEAQLISPLNKSEVQQTYTIKHLASGNFIHTPSVVFRNGLIKVLPGWFKDSPVGDYVLYLLLAQFGKIKYFPETMATYRRHANGVWGRKSQVYQSTRWVWMLEKVIEEFNDNEVVNLLLRQKAANEFYISNDYKNEGNSKEYFLWLRKACISSPVFFEDWVKEMQHKIDDATSKPNILYRVRRRIKKVFE